MEQEPTRTEELLLLYREGYGALGLLLKGYSECSGLLYLQSYRVDLAVQLAEAQAFDLLRVEYVLTKPVGDFGQILRVTELAHLPRGVSYLSVMAEFIAEVLDLVLQRDRGDPQLYQFFLQEQKRLCDAEKDGYYLPRFLWGLIDLLGYRPQGVHFPDLSFFQVRKRGRKEMSGAEGDLQAEYCSLVRGMLSYLCFHLEIPILPERWRRMYGLLTRLSSCTCARS